LDDFVGGFVQSGIDDLEAGVSERAGDDVSPAVVAVEADFGDETPNRLRFLFAAHTHTFPSRPFDFNGK